MSIYDICKPVRFVINCYCFYTILFSYESKALEAVAMISHIDQKRVLFVTTKNLDYIRNVQEINLIKKHASSCRILGSSSRHYPIRLLNVFLLLLKTPAIDFDTVFVGHASQSVVPFFYRKFRKNFVITDFFVSLYDTFCNDRKKIRANSAAGRLLHWIDEATISHADLIVCDTRAHGEYFVREFSASPSRLYPLYLEADFSLYHPVAVQRPACLRDKFIVLYFGSVLPLQGVDIVLKAMSRLKENKDFFFYFIGPVKGRNLQDLCPLADNIEYIRWLSQEQLAEYIARADLCLAGHFNAEIEKASRTIPGKAYIYHAMQKPMILGDNPANHELFAPDCDTLFVKMGSAEALAEAILDFYRLHRKRL